MIEKIVKIEQVDINSLRYDITVEDNHNFFANEILVHNCQNLKREIFSNVDVTRYEVSVKLDGSSITNYGVLKTDIDGDTSFEIGVCSRNLDLKLDQEGNTFIDMSKKNGLLEVINLMQEEIAIQGEMIAPKIQGNRENVPYPQFHVFKIFDIKTQEYLLPQERISKFNQIQHFAKTHGIQLELYHVPILHTSVTLNDLGIATMDELLQFL